MMLAPRQPLLLVYQEVIQLMLREGGEFIRQAIFTAKVMNIVLDIAYFLAHFKFAQIKFFLKVMLLNLFSSESMMVLERSNFKNLIFELL